MGYCCWIVYGLFLWSITKVRPEMAKVLLGRLGHGRRLIATTPTK